MAPPYQPGTINGSQVQYLCLLCFGLSTTIERVSELIDPSNWSWRQELVRNNFIAPDAEAILNIPIRQGGGDDFLAWAFERSGNYTVKSAYRALVTQKERVALEEGTATGTSEDDT